MINKVYNNIKYYFVIIFFIPFAAPAQTPDIKPPLMNSDGAACAIHIEKDYNIKRRLDEIGCVKGDSVLLYNYSSLAKWEVILPVRIAAAMICDMNKSVTDIGTVGSKPYQSVICTYSGKVRTLKSNDENLSGWQLF